MFLLAGSKTAQHKVSGKLSDEYGLCLFFL